MPNRCTPVEVFVKDDSEGDLLVDIRGEPALIHHDENGTAHILLSEATGFTERLEESTVLGEAPASVNLVSGWMNTSANNMACRQ